MSDFFHVPGRMVYDGLENPPKNEESEVPESVVDVEIETQEDEPDPDAEAPQESPQSEGSTAPAEQRKPFQINPETFVATADNLIAATKKLIGTEEKPVKGATLGQINELLSKLVVPMDQAQGFVDICKRTNSKQGKGTEVLLEQLKSDRARLLEVKEKLESRA